jgi:hypothetical protein
METSPSPEVITMAELRTFSYAEEMTNFSIPLLRVGSYFSDSGGCVQECFWREGNIS